MRAQAIDTHPVISLLSSSSLCGVVGWRAWQVAVVDPLLKLLLAALLDQAEVVDPGRLGRRHGRLGAWVDVTFDLQRDRQPDVPAIDLHGDVGQLERVEHEIDLAARELGVDLVGVAVHPDRAGLGHRPPL